MSSSCRSVIICCNAYPPKFIGGAELIAHYQAKELIKQGHRVVVLAAETYSVNKQYEFYEDSFEGITVYRIRMDFDNFDISYVNFFNNHVNKAFEMLVDKYNADVLHAHNLIGLSLGIFDIAKKRGMKTVLTLHDHWGYCLKNTILHSSGNICTDTSHCTDCLPALTGGGINIPLKFRKDYFKHIYDKIDVLISPSQYLADGYEKNFITNRKVNVIWNGIDVDKYKQIKKKPSNKIRFTYIGYLGHHKGIQVFLDAAKMSKYRDKIEINFAGSGENVEAYQDFVKNNGLADTVNFLGRVPNSEIMQVYEKTDVYVLASIWPENQPVSITEAMSCGIPVITSDIGGSVELVEDGVTGFHFKAGSAADLAAKMDYFAENPEKISEFGRNGLQKIEPFTFSEQVKKIVAKYNEDSSFVPVHSRKVKIAVVGKTVPDNISSGLCNSAEFYKIDWMWDDLLKIDIIVLLEDSGLSADDLFSLIRTSSAAVIVPESNSDMTTLVKKYNCGLYYVNAHNIYKYLEYLLTNNFQLRSLQYRANVLLGNK